MFGNPNNSIPLNAKEPVGILVLRIIPSKAWPDVVDYRLDVRFGSDHKLVALDPAVIAAFLGLSLKQLMNYTRPGNYVLSGSLSICY